jgi:hypothetical protein
MIHRGDCVLSCQGNEPIPLRIKERVVLNDECPCRLLGDQVEGRLQFRWSAGPEHKQAPMERVSSRLHALDMAIHFGHVWVD